MLPALRRRRKPHPLAHPGPSPLRWRGGADGAPSTSMGVVAPWARRASQVECTFSAGPYTAGPARTIVGASMAERPRDLYSRLDEVDAPTLATIAEVLELRGR